MMFGPYGEAAEWRDGSRAHVLKIHKRAVLLLEVGVGLRMP